MLEFIDKMPTVIEWKPLKCNSEQNTPSSFHQIYKGDGLKREGKAPLGIQNRTE
jgi:hypothetical protein